MAIAGSQWSRNRLEKVIRALFILVLFIFPVIARASDRCEEWMARIESVQGTVLVQKADQANWTPAGPGEELCPKDKIQVLANSRAAIFLRTGAVVRLDQNTTINLVGVEEGRRSIVDIISGIALFFSRNPFSLKAIYLSARCH